MPEPTAAELKRGTTVWGPPGGVPGVCMTCGEPARSSKAFYCEEHKRSHGRPIKAKKAADVPRETEPDASPEAPGGAYAAERTPTDPAAVAAKKDGKGVLGKLWGKGTAAGEKEPATPKTDERRPATPKRRASTAAFWGDCVGPMAAISARAGYVPMARAMEWSSPVVGEIIEDATRGTLVDRGIQPLVRNSEKWQDLFDLLGFWGAIGLAQRNPAKAPAALDFARKRFVSLLPRIAKKMKEERAKEKAAVDALTELMPDIRELFPEAGPEDDPVGLLIQSLFAAPEGVPEPQPADVS